MRHELGVLYFVRNEAGCLFSDSSLECCQISPRAVDSDL